MVLDAFDKHWFVQVTTVRRKVYVGFIRQGSAINQRGEIPDFAIMPVFSGYHDRDTLEKHIDVSDAYLSVVEKLSHQKLSRDEAVVQAQESSVVIPVSEIALIRRVDEASIESILSPDDDVDERVYVGQIRL